MALLLRIAVCLIFACCGRSSAISRAPSDSTRAHLLSLIVDVNGAQGAVYAAKDNQGRTMDTAKIIQAPEGDYIAVYHTLRDDGRFHAAIATSTDLLNFQFATDFGTGSSQPTVFFVGDGSYVMAWEQDPNNHIAVRYFPDRKHLLAATPTRSFDAPMTLSTCAEGTPNIYSVQLSPDIDHSVIDIGGHYFRNCEVDRQQRGTLKNFNHWVTAPRLDVDNAILFWGVQGNIGDRDPVVFDGFTFQLMEGMFSKGDFGSFRAFFTAFANPSISRIVSPQGKNAIVVGLFLPSKGAPSGEAGQLIFYREF
ncbi:hypothetical protein B0H19DRAFT_1263424 [Mycena capillaripes]|nr:hypothetical protein B0H19DRAFT_1263424 [Mycena capillaripes]